MSRIIREKITCPVCGTQTESAVWESVNTMIDPEMKESVRTGEIFRFMCTKCGHSVKVDYHFLYHQMEDEMMIYYVDADAVEETYELFRGECLQDIMGWEMRKNYLYRIVTRHNQLLEKLMIFDNGFDDRVIEIIKQFVVMQFFHKNPDKEIDEVLFWKNHNGEHVIMLFWNGKVLAEANIPMDMYEHIAEKYGLNEENLRTDDIVIDWEWAFGKLDMDL